jgi:hypothetical protein
MGTVEVMGKRARVYTKGVPVAASTKTATPRSIGAAKFTLTA